MFSMIRRLAFFRRLPHIKLVYTAQPLFNAETVAHYPAFQDDFTVLNRYLFPVYARLDEQAVRGQNTARLLGCARLVTTMSLAMCSSVRLAVGGGMLGAGFRFAEILFGIAVGVVNQIEQTSTAHTEYIQARLASEKLRQLAFAYLGKRGAYAENATRQTALCQQIAVIEKGARLNG
ncbi:MAG TPA: DUF4231 domain-containing protein [Chroococcales cyanobacterium]